MIAGRMVAMVVDHRLVLAIGLCMFGSGCYLDSFLTPDSRFEEFVVPQLFRGMALMFCFISVNDIALGTMARDQIQNASSLYNLTRNLGGAIGLAVVNSLLTTKRKVYEQYLGVPIPVMLLLN